MTGDDTTAGVDRALHRSDRKRILAVCSGGGHWVEMLRLAPALEGHDVTWVTTDEAYRDQVPFGSFATVPDSSMWSKHRLVITALHVARQVVRMRPDIVLSTGAAPGWFAVRLGGLLGARTVWIDSIANADELSLSGQRLVGRVDLFLTQWPHLATPHGPVYRGAVV